MSSSAAFSKPGIFARADRSDETRKMAHSSRYLVFVVLPLSSSTSSFSPSSFSTRFLTCLICRRLSSLRSDFIGEARFPPFREGGQLRHPSAVLDSPRSLAFALLTIKRLSTSSPLPSSLPLSSPAMRAASSLLRLSSSRAS